MGSSAGVANILPARRLATSPLPFGSVCSDVLALAARVLRPFVFVVRLLATRLHLDACHLRRVFVRWRHRAATSDRADNMSCMVVGALLRLRASATLLAAFSPAAAISIPRRRSPSHVCANARRFFPLFPLRRLPLSSLSLSPGFALAAFALAPPRSPSPLCALRYAPRARHASRRAGYYVVGRVVGALLICSHSARIRTSHRAKRSTPFGIMGRAQIVSGKIIASDRCRGRSPFFEKTGGEETFLSLRREIQKK